MPVMSVDIRIIKKYPNRRLYDTATSSYITLEDVKKLVLDNVEFKVEDAKTKEDLTRAIYGNATPPTLSADAWTEFLKMQGPAMQGLMGSYLEQSASAFIEMQQQMQKQTRSLFGNFPFPNFAAAANPFAQPPHDDAAGAPSGSPAPKDEGGSKDGA